MKTWNIEQLTGYRPKTTFYEDFTIADRFGISGVMNTFNRAINEWRTNFVYLTELVMVMSWKSFEHNASGSEELCELYSNLYYEADEIALNELKGDELEYYLRTTD